MISLNDARENRLRQVLTVIDLSLDLDRNLDDSNFVRDGGRVRMVLDENIFEMFIRPSRYSEAVQTFYASIWSDRHLNLTEWRSFEVQTAMITAEFLVGGTQGTAVELLMTEFHRWELSHRVDALIGELRSELDVPAKEDWADRYSDLMRSMRASKVQGSAAAIGGSLLRTDLDGLLKAGAPTDLVDRVQLARAAAEFLVDDERSEAIEQLQRVVGHGIRSRLKSLDTLFSPSVDDLQQIDAEAEKWFVRLVGEIKKPGNRKRHRAFSLEPRALWNDARSIAYVQWVVRSSTSTAERVVFVTADSIVFDAYRRWHASRTSDDPIEPFFMRRARQYAPIFNPQETRGDLSVTTGSTPGREFLFGLVQQAVEAALLPFTAALAEGKTSDGGQPLGLRRELLALKLVDVESILEDEQLRPIRDRLSDTWLAQNGAQLQGVRDLWQQAQRASIGASYDLISVRVTDERAQFADTLTASGDKSKAFTEYVAGLLEKLVSDSLQLWLPLADNFAALEVDEHAKNGRVRQYRAVELDEAFANLARPDGIPTPGYVFASASLKGLMVLDIELADRFAGLAVRSLASDDDDTMWHQRALHEVRYLSAVARKLLLATYDSHIRARFEDRSYSQYQRGIDQTKYAYSYAISAIHRCLSYHHDFIESANRDDEYHGARYLRALSERASINLFMSISTWLSRTDLSAAADEASRYLHLAKGDIRMCIEMEENLRGSPTLLAAIRAQFIPNVASAGVLDYIIAGARGPIIIDGWMVKLAPRVRSFFHAVKSPHPLLAAELYGFLSLLERANRGQSVPMPPVLKSQQRSPGLPLDRALYFEILRKVIRPSRAASASNRSRH